MVVCLDSNCRVWHRSALVTSLMTSLVITDLVLHFYPLVWEHQYYRLYYS